MRTILKTLAVVVGVSFCLVAAKAQQGQSFSFINPNYTGLYLSNSATYLTNLLSVNNSITTNLVGVLATNNSGTEVISNNIANVNLLRTVPNWSDRNAAYVSAASSNQVLFVKIPSAYAGAKATNGFVLVFAPCPNGVNDTSATADTYTVSNAPAASVAGNYMFAWPANKFIGCRGIMLQKAYPLVAAAAADSQFVITEITLSGFVP